MEFLDLISGAPVAVMLGMCKNAGKTTALCRLIREYAAKGGPPLALTSIGRDGETRDLVTGTDKPPIFLYEGMLAATASELLPLCDVSREILAATGLYTSLGEVILFRARSDGYVQLAGPGIVEHLKQLRESFAAFGAGCILIDGALNRKSPLSGAADGVCILSTGASLDRDMDKVVEETAFAAALLSLPEMKLPVPDPGRLTRISKAGEKEEIAAPADLRKVEAGDILWLSGALTESAAKAFLRNGGEKEGLTILVKDSSCLMLRRESWEALTKRGVRFAVLKGSRLAGITVNAVSSGGWQFDPKAFAERMRAAVPVPVWDVMADD
ncbi:MAG: hypothetical protein II882_06140 [Lachnospiraceae bacterium]|nr:hypothetical protein [Lachnospiraceae bacterium]